MHIRFAAASLLFLSLSVSPLTAGPIEVNDQNFQSLSRSRPVLAILSLDCDMGGYAASMFQRANADVQGLQLGVINYNAVSVIHSQIYQLYQQQSVNPGPDGVTLGTLLLIKDGRVVHTSQMGYPGRAPGPFSLGVADERRWLIHALETHGINAQLSYRPAPADRVNPAPDSSSVVQLNQGKIAEYSFSDGKDLLGRQRDFVAEGRSRIAAGVVTLDGKYDGDSTAYFLFRSEAEEPYKSGFTVSFNFRMAEINPKRAQIATLGNHLFHFTVFREKLLLNVDPTYFRGMQGSMGSWDFRIDDAPLRANVWHNLSFAFDPAAKRARIVFDGRRLKDLALDDLLLARLADYEAGANFHSGSLGIEFTDFSWGGVFNGAADNVVVYNRALSGRELIALARAQSDPNQPVPPINNANQAQLDLALLRAAHGGDAARTAQLIEQGANVDAMHRGWTALHYAAHFGHRETVEILIELRANVLLTVQGHTAQSLARLQGHQQIVAMLEDVSNTERFYSARSFPLVQHRSVAEPPAP